MFYIMSESDIQFFEKKKKTFVLRIHEKEQKVRPLFFESDKELSLCFHDISLQAIQYNNGDLPSNWVIFSEEMAAKVYTFFQEIEKETNYDIIIHCYAGFSRSSAFAFAYSWFKKNLSLEQFLMNQHYTPNTLVLQRMNDVMNADKQRIIDYYKQIK